ncbi:oxidoreductase [Erysipelotrichaceae bacterium]|nr:oxidoreductase [Erysipelotrichaceae bacterium]
MKHIYVIGAGPAGMMAAISAKKHFPNFTVELIESNAIVGKKLRTTGGGRCNVTADLSNEAVIQNIPKNGKFLYSALNNFNTTDIQNFFKQNGCPLKVEDHYRVFPESNKAIDIINTLSDEITRIGAKIHFGVCLVDINIEERKLLFSNNTSHRFDGLILSTGGICVPQSGSNGLGHKLAMLFGHTITELLPAEVPLVSNDQCIQTKVLQGLSFKDVTLSISNGKKIVHSITHDLLFTHFGISGPAALRASFYVQNLFKKVRPVQLFIDFLPTYTVQDLQTELQKQKTDPLGYFTSLGLPKRLITFLLESLPQNLQSKEIILLVNIFKNFPLSVYETRGFTQAFVTNGGISLKEVNPQTLQSKISPHLAFAGEILDVNGYTGGFNITAALATGYTAGKFIGEGL